MSDLEECISRLYGNVLFREITENGLSDSEIRDGIRIVTGVYSPESMTFDSGVLRLPVFGDAALRCAYLHKYAPLHTRVVLDAMLRMMRVDPGPFRELWGRLKVCSLGGGPGSDVVGVLAAMRAVFDPFGSSVTVVDCMEKWRRTFAYVLRELEVGRYGAMWKDDVGRSCEWNYIGHNLLGPMTSEVNRAVAGASLVTMIKFVSAAACSGTEDMVDKIFRVMKVGAFVLYIDNAAGGFTQLIERSSRRNGLVPAVGPFKHVRYDTEGLKVHRFGYNSCYQTTVTIVLLQKVHPNPSLNLNNLLQSGPTPRNKVDFEYCRNDPVSNRPPLDVNVFSPELDNTSDSKCPEKLMNNLKTSPATSTNPARNSWDFSGTPAAVTPPEASAVTPRKSNPTFSQTSDRVSPRGNTNSTFLQELNCVSQPVSWTPAAAQRYRPLSSIQNDEPSEELADYPDDADCSCCVIS